ncbi:putative polyol transporter 6 isoform X2 [Canna indica]|uniref:Polyol transporter 6 isoform X2 n=1 Tax=Canna indica TaxID=4628 RepID=A0AAQ3QLD7_9LILI|nr:putative polyol transporter 6 isoform X2 [Canna indica]
MLLRLTPMVRHVLTATIGVHFFQHTIGIEAIVLYIPQIFKKADLVTKNQQFLAPIGVGVVKTVFILLAILLVDKVKRRKLFLSSITWMILSLIGLGIVLTMIEHSQLAINRVMNSAMSMSFVWLYKSITIGGAFFLFSGVGVIGWVFYFLCCPKTRGRVLEEEMEEVFLKP